MGSFSADDLAKVLDAHRHTMHIERRVTEVPVHDPLCFIPHMIFLLWSFKAVSRSPNNKDDEEGGIVCIKADLLLYTPPQPPFFNFFSQEHTHIAGGSYGNPVCSGRGPARCSSSGPALTCAG